MSDVVCRLPTGFTPLAHRPPTGPSTRAVATFPPIASSSRTLSLPPSLMISTNELRLVQIDVGRSNSEFVVPQYSPSLPSPRKKVKRCEKDTNDGENDLAMLDSSLVETCPTAQISPRELPFEFFRSPPVASLTINCAKADFAHAVWSPPLTPPFRPDSLSTSNLPQPQPRPTLSPTPLIPFTSVTNHPQSHPQSWYDGPNTSARLAGYACQPHFAHQYAVCEQLGAGGFGFVVRALRRKDGNSVAVKFIDKRKMLLSSLVHSRSWIPTPGMFPPSNGVMTLPLEAYVLSKVSHEGVVGFFDLFEDFNFYYLVMELHGSPWVRPGPGVPVFPRPPIVISESLARSASAKSPSTLTRPAFMERTSSCDLFECIEQHTRFSEDTSKFIFGQIVDAVHVLGKMGICHCDLKDENITISSSYEVKLIDFGSAVIFDATEPSPFYNRSNGTTSFACAESLRGEKFQAPNSDVWSLGIILSILLTGECPFADRAAATVGRLSPPKIPLSYQVQHLIENCLDIDPATRITTSGILRHPWLQ